MVAPENPSPTAPPRSRVILALLAVFAVFQGLILYSNAHIFHENSAGFVVHYDMELKQCAHPVTDPAKEATRSLQGDPYIVSVNGIDVPSTMYPRDVEALFDTSAGASNHFVLRDHHGASLEATLPTARPSSQAITHTASAYFHLMGLLYFAVGLFVWWKRPEDPATEPLLAFTMIAATAMAFPIPYDELSRGLLEASHAFFPLYGPGILYLALKFTGFHNHLKARILLKALTAVAVFVAMTRLACYQWIGWGGPSVARALTNGEIAVSLIAALGVTWRASRPPHPMAIRQRAKVLAIACAAAFAAPTVLLFFPTAFPGVWIINLIALATFPVVIGYAIVRHRLFDVRVVLRKGLVYVLLSVGVLVAYLALVFAGVSIVNSLPKSPGAIAIIVAVLVVGLSLVQLRVQGAINRFVFRSRYLYAEAVADASARLARARSLGGVAATVRSALMDAMQLSRASFAVYDAEANTLRTISLGSKPDPRTGRSTHPLPDQIDPSKFTPIRRALETRELATAYDSDATVAQVILESSEPHTDSQGCWCEGSFWKRFGIEAIVPLTVGAEDDGSRVVGLLLLGPKTNDRPIDEEDHALVFTLANQLAVGIENAMAFEQIQSMKENLEDQVEERTLELKRKHSQLLQSEKMASLGQLVAGVAHEINTPLGAIKSNHDVLTKSVARLKEQLDSDSMPESVRADAKIEKLLGGASKVNTVSEQAIERITKIVGSLRKFARLDEADKDTVDLHQGLESTLTLVNHALKGRIEVVKEYGKLPNVECYPNQLNQVFMNLLVNASQAIEGEGTITLRTRRDGDEVVVEIQDTGRGIPPEAQTRIFDPGFTTKGVGVGTGLGLSIVHQIIDDHHGSIEVGSELGEGSTFRIRLPIALGESRPRTPVPPRQEAERAPS